MLSGGVFNVVELPFAEDTLDAGESGYSALVAALGLGFLAGSLTGASGGAASLLKRRFVQGILLTGVAGLLTAASPGLDTALLAFALGGFGNGLVRDLPAPAHPVGGPGALPRADLRADGHAGLVGDGGRAAGRRRADDRVRARASCWRSPACGRSRWRCWRPSSCAGTGGTGPRRCPQLVVTASLRRTSESSIRMSSAARLSGWASWTTSTRAATIVGSNCVPALACSSSSASAVLIALR